MVRNTKKLNIWKTEHDSSITLKDILSQTAQRYSLEKVAYFNLSVVVGYYVKYEENEESPKCSAPTNHMNE